MSEETIANVCKTVAGQFKTDVVDSECVTVGHGEMAVAGMRGKATAGHYGQAFAGDCGTAVAGDYGTAAVGTLGKASAGRGGIAIAGIAGSASAGHGGTIFIRYWDKAASQYAMQMGIIGKDGLLPDTFYELDDNFNFVEVLPESEGTGVSDDEPKEQA